MNTNSTCDNQIASRASRAARLLQLGLDAGPKDFPTLNPGDWVGRYQIVERIDEGGSGVVFLAQQFEPIRRRVALKLIKPGMDTRQVIARFEAERQALASLDHPNIAKIFDAGATDADRPFFAMEFVRGEKIIEFCDRKRFRLDERLKLFMQICRAVQHAHEAGIIHRDLKSSNILVSEAEDDATVVPKIIDFGIAKTMQSPLTENMTLTLAHQFLGTPACMSPEQANAGRVDERTDIYSLGVLLYELLAGVTPFDAEHFQRLKPHEILRFIRETEPPRPSSRFATLARSQRNSIADSRQTNGSRLQNALRGDLDCIVMKCLSQEPARRYQTPLTLARDVERHLQSQPVSARETALFAHFQKMASRNLLAVCAGSSVAIAILMATLLIAQQNIRSNHARLAQEELRRDAEVKQTGNAEVARMLTKILRGAQPSVALGRDTTMLRGVLDRVGAQAGSDLNNQPEAQTQIFTTAAETYHELGLYEKMAASARESLEKFSRNDESLAKARALAALADAEKHLGRLDSAERITRKALELRQKLPGNDEPDVSGLTGNLGLVLREEKKFRKADELFQNALSMDEKSHTPDAKIATDLSNLASALFDQGEFATAEQRYRECLDLRRKIFGQEHPGIALTLDNLAVVLAHERKFEDAERLAREALAMDRKFLNADHPDLRSALGNLSTILAAQDKWTEAEALDREALDLSRKFSRSGGNEAIGNLADDLAKEGKLAEAESIRRELPEAK